MEETATEILTDRTRNTVEKRERESQIYIERE